MSYNETNVKLTWKNGLIWAGIMSAVSLAVRFILWYFVMGMDFKTFSDDFYSTACPLLLVPFLVAVLMFLMMYSGYIRIGRKAPTNLHLVARDKLGKPFIVPLILLIVLELLWIVVSVSVEVVAQKIPLRYMMEVDAKALGIFAGLLFAGLVLDLVLFLVGKRYFKPGLIQDKHT